MNKICTTIEQSQRLIELGIDVNTADMWWNTEKSHPEFMKTYHEYLGKQVSPISVWSLSALLKLIPSAKIEKQTSSMQESEWSCSCHIEFNPSLPESHEVHGFNEPVDAAVEMIAWLLESSY